MIEKELKAIIEEAQTELEEPFEPEAVEALKIAANKLAYLKKYYDCVSDKIIYFPSVTKLLLHCNTQSFEMRIAF